MASTSLKKTASHSASSKATGSKTAAVAGGNSNQKVTHAFMQKDPKLANNWKKKAPHELSDAEVLSMPEAEYMNDAQMAFFKHKLQLLRDEILENAGETAEHLREDAVVVPDPVDRATIEEEHPRPRAQTAQENRAIHPANRRRRIRLLQRNRRAHWRSTVAGTSHGITLARSTAAP